MDHSTSAAARKQPEWKAPEPTKKGSDESLSIYNTLTRTKVPFVPLNSSRVSWYSCGPTVYNPAHMGHARNYVSIDINRRVVQDYFGYNVFFVQNVTDIDDKIILKARQAHLYKEFVKNHSSVTPELTSLVDEAITLYLQQNFKLNSVDEYKAFRSTVDINKEKETNPKLPMHVRAVDEAIAATTASASASALDQLLAGTKNVVLPLLDAKYGATVNDPKVFRETAAYWENEFDKDMKQLNVLPPSLTTRVSEYIPEIITFTQKILANGFAYQANDGVYFDTAAFEDAPDHFYAKLQPWNKGVQELIDEGEGSLSTGLQGKKSKNDFALWKASKPGEPEWESPWGMGRPGWHIECSVMATEVLGPNIDIHSGGIDLAFPHHDNEIAQSEACLNQDSWVNYFMHTGHLHIEGQKMSKSLKNFISIEEALQIYTVRQIRLAFAMQQWNNNFDFKTELHEVKSFENMLTNFFRNVKALSREAAEHGGSKKAGKSELALYTALGEAQSKLHKAFCDNLAVPEGLQAISQLVQECNAYIQQNQREIRVEVLMESARWVTKILNILGFDTAADGVGWGAAASSANGSLESKEEVVMPYIQEFSKFRDLVRAKAIARAPYGDFLLSTDELRNTKLLDLGVALDDRTDGQPALVKLLSDSEKAELIKQRDDKIKREQEKIERKKKQQELEAQKQADRMERAKTPAEELFTSNAEYSAFDERGIPTTDKEGKPLSKSSLKKLIKQWEQQKKLHDEFLASK